VSSPRPLRDWVHPLMHFAFSSEYVSVPDPPQTFPPPVPSVRFRPPSRHRLNESTCNGQSQVRLVPPSAFLPLSMVYSSLSFLGLFHPKAASEINLSGVFPAVKPSHLIDVPFPLAISTETLLRSCLHNASSRRPSYRALILTAIRNTNRNV